MTSNLFSTEGIVIARKTYGEADRILTIFSKSYGKIRVLAKGVRKPKSKKRGHIEVFSHLKFSAKKLEGINIISEALVIDDFSDFRKDIKKVALAYYFVEVISKLTNFEEKNSELFSLLLTYLQKLISETKLKNFRKSFVGEVLVLLGFWPLGKPIVDVDKILEEVSERKMSSFRVGLQMLQ